MATKRTPTPYRLTFTVALPPERLTELKREAKRTGLTLDEHVATIVAGTRPAERAAPTSGPCRHPRTRPEPKIPGMKVCTDCGARLVA